MALLHNQVDDFVNLTISHFKRNKFVDLSMQYPEYIASRVITSKKVVERGGPDIRFKLQTKNTGLARKTGLYAQDITGVEDLTTEGILTWTKETCNWSYDIDEPLFQSDNETIISELLIREHACMNDITELREEELWSSPTSSTDNKSAAGIPFWLQTSVATPEGAFNGSNPGASWYRAGIDSTSVTAFKNWTFGYERVDQDDLVRKIKKAKYRTNFKSPNRHPELAYGKSDYHIFTVYDVREPLERLAESRNENLGNDVAKYVNDVTICGIPVEAVHYLDENYATTKPLFGVNWGVFRPYVKSGCNMRRTAKKAANQHTVREVHYDTWYNYACYNLRECFVGSLS